MLPVHMAAPVPTHPYLSSMDPNVVPYLRVCPAVKAQARPREDYCADKIRGGVIVLMMIQGARHH